MSTEAHNDETEGTEADKINTGALGTLVVVGLCAMISICAAVTALVRHDIDVEQSDKDEDANDTVVALKAAQRGVLNGPASYLDRGKGLVSLPIESAKQIVVAELARDPNSATPPPPAGSAAPPADTAPASGPATPAPANGLKKPEETKKSADDKKAGGAKTEKVKEKAPPAKPAPTSPPLSPTAASPGAQAPGPLKN
jgi:hypothetical protein